MFLDQKTFLMAIFYFWLIFIFFPFTPSSVYSFSQLLCDHNVPGSMLETKNLSVYKIIYPVEETGMQIRQ